jgi:hypothetical protein
MPRLKQHFFNGLLELRGVFRQLYPILFQSMQLQQLFNILIHSGILPIGVKLPNIQQGACQTD